MNKVFIHCGAPKTGTSYLQVLFAQYSGDLLKSNIVYPEDASVDSARSGAVTSGNGVEMANYICPNLPHNIGDKDAFLPRLENLLEQHKGKNLLFSSEFITFPEGERTQNIRRSIESAGYQPQIIYLVRDIATAARSTYSQQVKRHGETRNFSDFLKSWDPLYHHHVSSIIEAFGVENLILLNYEQEKDNLADLLFKRVLGVDFPIEGSFVINRSLTDTEIEMLRLMNQHFPPNQRNLSTFVSDALLEIQKDKITTSTSVSEFEYFKTRFGKSLGFLNQYIIGQPLRITSNLQDSGPATQIGDFEVAMLAVLAKLVTRSLQGKG